MNKRHPNVKIWQGEWRVSAFDKAITTLPILHGGNSTCVLEFYEKLLTHVQSLKIMEKLNAIKRYVRNMLNKLPQI